MNNKLQNITRLKGELQKDTSSYLDSLTITKAVELDPDNILVLNKEDPRKTTDLATILIVRLAKNLNITNNLTGEQIHKIAQDIIRYHNTLTMEDIYLCFERISHGLYGKLYGNLSMDFIHDSLRKYGETKDGHLADQRAKKNKAIKLEEAKANVTDEDVKRHIKEIYEKIDKIGRAGTRTISEIKKPPEIKVKPPVKIAEDIIHYVLATGIDKISSVKSRFNVSTEMATEIIKLIKPYALYDNFGNTKMILYPDIWAGFNEDDPSDFAILCKRISK